MRRGWPVVCAIFGGCAPAGLDADEASRWLTATQPSVYQVYQPGLSDDEVHGILSRVFIGDALTTEYITHTVNRERMRDQDIGVTIQGVDHGEAIARVTPDHVEVDLTWWTRGLVRHEAHVHPRINHYRAMFDVAPRRGAWRVIESRMRNIERVQTAMRESTLFGDPSGDEAPPSADGFIDPLDLLELRGEGERP